MIRCSGKYWTIIIHVLNIYLEMKLADKANIYILQNLFHLIGNFIVDVLYYGIYYIYSIYIVYGIL